MYIDLCVYSVIMFIISCIHAHTEVQFIDTCNMTSYLTLPHVTGVLSSVTEAFNLSFPWFNINYHYQLSFVTLY